MLFHNSGLELHGYKSPAMPCCSALLKSVAIHGNPALLATVQVVWSLDASSCQCINVKLRLQPPQVAQEGGSVPGAHGRDVLLAGDCKRWGYALHPLT